MRFKRGGSYIDSPDWIKKKKTAINPKNDNDRCFQYTATTALNRVKTESHTGKEWIIHQKLRIGKDLKKNN